MLWLGRKGIVRTQLGRLAVVPIVVAGQVVEGGEDRPAMQSLCRCTFAGEGKARPIRCMCGAVRRCATHQDVRVACSHVHVYRPKLSKPVTLPGSWS